MMTHYVHPITKTTPKLPKPNDYNSYPWYNTTLTEVSPPHPCSLKLSWAHFARLTYET